MTSSIIRKPIALLSLVVLVILLLACSPGAAPGATPTKPPAGGATPAATKPAAGATPGAADGLSAAAQKAAAEVPANYKGKKSPFAATAQAAVTAGEAIYKQRCLTCHGEKGDGKGPAGASLNPPPANYGAAEQLEHFEKVQDHHFWRVSEGVPGTAMPPFKGQLSEEQIWQVLTYEWSLGNKLAGR